MFKKKKNRGIQEKETQDDKYSQLEKVAIHIEKMRLGDYVEMMGRPGRIIWTNFLGGIAKGVGLTIGATLVIAILFKLLSALIAMNIPYLTDMLQEVVQIIKETPGGQSINMSQINVPDMPDQTELTLQGQEEIKE